MRNFEVPISDTRLIVGDPAYLRDDLANTLIVANALPGVWVADFTRVPLHGWGHRNVQLIARCAMGFNFEDKSVQNWLKQDVPLWVASGSAGIFVYDDWSQLENTDAFREECFEREESIANIGYTKSVPGVVSATGCGDGAYPITLGRNVDNQVVAVKLVFASVEIREQ